MKRLVVLLLLLIFLFSLGAQPLPTYEPYAKEEFSIWTYKIRRAESLFFGSLAITFPLSYGLYSLARSSGLISTPSSDLNALLIQSSIAASLSLGLAVADYVVGEMRGQ